jgi:hypothetical protein
MRHLSLLLVGVAACSGSSLEERAARHASAVLGEPVSELRVTHQSDLTAEHHSFHLVTRDDGPSLLVVLPEGGPAFDSRTEGAFDRVAKSEGAVENLSRIGAERVALWFATLGGGKCPMPASDDAHFATVERLPDGALRLSYPAGKSAEMTRTCTIELEPDGTLRDAHVIEQRAASVSALSWRSGT